MNNEDIARIIILLSALKKGKMEAFDEFYQLTKRPLYYSLLAISKSEVLAEDLMEETYIKFLHNLSKVKDKKNPLGYLLVSGRNLALDYFKKHNRVTSIEDYQNESEIGAYVEEKYDDSETLLRLMASLLTEEEYEIVVLFVLSELTHKEIAGQLKKPLGTITWKYNQAIKKLQKGLENYEY